MEVFIDIIMEIIGALLEGATEKTARKHGRLKATLCLSAVLLVFVAALILGIHWVSIGSILPGILMFVLDGLIIAVFVIAMNRFKP